MGVLEILVLVVVVALIFWLLQYKVAPALPAPWGSVLVAVFAILVIIFLLSRFFPGILGARIG